MNKELLDGRLGNVLFELYRLDIIKEIAGLLEGEQSVLLALGYYNATTQTEICAITGIAKNRMSAIISSLNKKDMVCVEPHKDDSRKKTVILTKLGQDTIEDKTLLLTQNIKRMFGYLEPSEVDKLIEILEKIIKGEKNNG